MCLKGNAYQVVRLIPQKDHPVADIYDLSAHYCHFLCSNYRPDLIIPCYSQSSTPVRRVTSHATLARKIDNIVETGRHELRLPSVSIAIMRGHKLVLMKGYGLADPSYMRLFKEIVIDVWKVELAQSAEVRRSLERKLAQVSEKKNRLVSGFLYENKIDKSTYEEQLDRLRQEAALAEMELHEAKLEEFDVEGILEFANHVLTELSRFWMQATLDQKIGLQNVLFPRGLTFDGQTFGTAKTCLAFSYLQEISDGKSSLASRTGVEPVSPP